ncbi:hypothetical protein Fleli_3067 [Bernardetia litoralis DSM 6794]|uniref:HipA-like kinase domain-containing protein n=1 Tax=Bernardetia litoralis (strain ATCC 23117 / DSM 6794 / NBRC 15988 / NCIMB 1366 / Fx l1 / Sio-4) TaxID=880071 RepID=I4AN72_BERLS|nr:HipA family kinase [Bernardetia litoralis]AFM05407.1 hypothetical protein Fleli_3067 [Bernardetia litoralis DSM 6794]
MKIPVYEAVEFKKILQDGGSTKPWLVEISVADKTEPYVVKVFKTTTLSQYPAIANEVFANILAKELGLSVPSIALVNFSDAFITTLSEQERKLVTGNFIDNRIKFASLYVSNTQIYSWASSDLDDWDIAGIYAFDNLIYNSDRKTIKPNLLLDMYNENYYLIDHELSINIINNNYITKIQKKEWLYNFKNHIFYEYLKILPSQDKQDIFAHFIEFFRHISVNCLDQANQQLISYGHDTTLSYFKSYLVYLKNNTSLFEEILQQQIQ